MKINQYFSNVIKALTGDKLENLQAPVFEELDGSATSKIVGGLGPKGTWKFTLPDVKASGPNGNW